MLFRSIKSIGSTGDPISSPIFQIDKSYQNSEDLFVQPDKILDNDKSGNDNFITPKRKRSQIETAKEQKKKSSKKKSIDKVEEKAVRKNLSDNKVIIPRKRMRNIGKDVATSAKSEKRKSLLSFDSQGLPALVRPIFKFIRSEL